MPSACSTFCAANDGLARPRVFYRKSCELFTCHVRLVVQYLLQLEHRVFFVRQLQQAMVLLIGEWWLRYPVRINACHRWSCVPTIDEGFLLLGSKVREKLCPF